MKNPNLLTVALLAATIGLASCGKQTPAENRTDVATAEAAGARDIAATKAQAADAMAGAQQDLNKTETAVAHEDAAARQNISVAEAEAAYKVAVERCGALAGDEKRLCKKHADAELELAKARANNVRADSDPKP